MDNAPTTLEDLIKDHNKMKKEYEDRISRLEQENSQLKYYINLIADKIPTFQIKNTFKD